jgi:hypothetical protein
MSPCLATVAGSRVEIAFPVARHHAGRHLGWVRGYRRPIGDLTSSIRPSRSRPARVARLMQPRQQCAPQSTAAQHIQAHIDGLRRQLFPHVVRIRAFKPPGNQLGRAVLGQLRPHVLPQPRIQEFARSSWLMGSGCRQRLCRAGPIGSAHCVAGKLAAHGAGRSWQHRSHCPQ